MEPEVQQNTHSLLPPVKTLLNKAWSRFVASIGGLFLVSTMTFVINILIGLAVAIFIILIMAISGVFTNPASITSTTFIRILPGIIISSILAIAAMVVMIFVNTAGTIAQVLVVNQSPGKIGTMESFKKALPLVVPLILTGLMTTLLLFGTLFLFLFPVIIFSYFFMFTNVAVILDGKKYRAALRSSMVMVGEHFGEILIRMLILAGFYLFGLVFIPEVMRRIAPETAVVLSIYMILVNILMSWYGLSYFITMYQQIKASTDTGKPGSLVWAGIVSLIGWFLLIGVIVLLVIFVPWDKVRKSLSDQTTPKYTLPNLNKNSGSSESDLLYETSQRLFTQMKAVTGSDELIRKTITQLNDKNIDILKQAIKVSPSDPKLWSALGDAYTWVSSTGTLQDSLHSYQKAEKLAPQNVVYINQVGDMLVQLKEYDSAILQYKKTLRLTTKSGYAYQGLGYAYAGLKIYDQAKVELKEAIRIFTAENSDGSYDQTILETQKFLSSVEQTSK